MASNVPHVPAMKEAQGPQEAIVNCVAFFLKRGKATRIECGFWF